MPLSECCWYIGNPRHAKTYFQAIHVNRSVVIIRCPLLRTRFGALYEHVPCGFTDESREIWEAFLALSGVPFRGGFWGYFPKAAYRAGRWFGGKTKWISAPALKGKQ